MKMHNDVRLSVLLLMGMALAGCSMFGIYNRVPMVEVRNDTVTASAGVDITDVILRAAGARKWNARVTAPGVVRCQFNARAWNIEVDVRHSGQTFSIDYVGSEGLGYRPEARDIHPSYNKQVEALRQRIKREALRMAPSVARGDAAAAPAQQVQAAKPYTVEHFAREAGDGFSYRFTLALTDSSSADLSLSRRIQADLRESVRSDYVAATGGKDASALRIEFPQYSFGNGKVEGRAVVLAVALQEFVYDPVTRRGRLAVKVDPRQYDATRQWVRNNIATLAKDKDPSLLNAFAGRSNFSIGREVLREDNVLEVEFKVGD
jgi:hypothetical protein